MREFGGYARNGYPSPPAVLSSPASQEQNLAGCSPAGAASVSPPSSGIGASSRDIKSCWATSSLRCARRALRVPRAAAALRSGSARIGLSSALELVPWSPFRAGSWGRCGQGHFAELLTDALDDDLQAGLGHGFAELPADDAACGRGRPPGRWRERVTALSVRGRALAPPGALSRGQRTPIRGSARN